MGTFNINASEVTNKWYRSAQLGLPVSEFDDPDFCLCGAFPDVFMYGKAYKRKDNGNAEHGHRESSKSLQAVHHRHLLFQYTAIPAKCRELIFYLYDRKTRHAVVRAFLSKVKSDDASIAKFASLQANPNFPDRLRNAIEKPNSKDAKEIMSELLPILSSAGGNKMLFGAMELNSSVSETLAMSQQFGAGSVFLTLTPDDIDNTSSFRLSFRSLTTRNSRPQ